MEFEASYVCPSCGEEIVIPVDPSEGARQDFVEDCPVCCSSNRILLEIGGASVISCAAESE